MSGPYAVRFYQQLLPGVYICYGRAGGNGPKGTGNTVEEAFENLQSLWCDMGMVPWEPGKNLIGGGRAEVVGDRCLLPAEAAAETDKIIKQLMEDSR